MNLKLLKRSKTSQSILFKQGKGPSLVKKHHNLFNQRIEENIERIASYLKQTLHESLMRREKEKEKEREKEKEKDKDKQKENNNNSKNDISNSNNIDFNMNIFDFGTIKYILNKFKRSLDEILIIKSYLSTMSFLNTLKIPISNDRLLYSLSIYLKIEKRSKDTLLFRYGNKGNKFYIVLEGEVSILILKETKALISFKRYFLHLLLLKMLKEDELIKKIIIANAKMKFHFDDKDFDGYFEKIVNFANKYFKKKKKINDIFNNNENGEENKEENDNENNDNEQGNEDNINESNISNNKNNITFKEKNILGFNRRRNVKLTVKENFENQKDKFNKNKDKDKDKDNVLVKTFIKDKNNIRLMTKTKTIKSKNIDAKSLLSPNVEGYKEEINYSHADLPYFEIHEVKEIILYYVYLREVIDTKKKDITIDEYINNTYLNSPYHKPLANELFSKKDLLIFYQYFEIARKKAGDSFGELALQREDNKRTGTALITTDCVLGYLSRSDYNAFLGEIEVKRRKNDISFVMSFAIFDKMNKNVFENRYFNFFTRENFFQGEKIIIQDKKINKIFFIKEGQFEITTNLSVNKIYSILQYKTKRVIDERKKVKLKNQSFNMRLYICYNKDILGLDDCSYKDGISFITAKCISSNGCAFTIEKSILKEIRTKIPEIEGKINIIKEKRDKVMVDRLLNIYNRIVQMNKKDKNNEKNKKKSDNKDTYKYINYLFGINQNEKNNEFKPISCRTNKNRIKSAFLLKKRKNTIDIFNKDNIENNIDNNIDNIIDNNYNSKRIKKHKSSENIFIFNDGGEYNSNEDLKGSAKKTALRRNNSLNILKINKDFFSPKKSEINNIISNDNKSINKNNDINENNKNNPILKRKISEIMTIKDRTYRIKDEKLMLKISEKLNKVSNKHTEKKFIALYSPINRIIKKEYSTLFNWLDTHQSGNISTKNKNKKSNTIDNKFLLKTKSSSKKFRCLSNKKNIYYNLNIQKRPLSCTNAQRMHFLNNVNDSTIKKDDDNNSTLKYEETPKFLLYHNDSASNKKVNKKHNKYSKEIMSCILSGDKINTKKLIKELDYEKYIKQIMGVRYRDHFVSYEEQKLVKFINNYKLQEKILNKGKRNKSKMINGSSSRYKSMTNEIKFNPSLLKK